MRSIETNEPAPSTPPVTSLLALSEDAAEWFLRAKDGRLSTSERKALADWLTQSPQHVAEFIRVYQLHGVLRQAKLQVFEPDPRAIPAPECETRGPAPRRYIAVLILCTAILGACLLLLLHP